MRLKKYLIATGSVIVLMTVCLVNSERNINVRAGLYAVRSDNPALFENYAKRLYDHLSVKELNYSAFKQALKGYLVLRAEKKLSNPYVLSLVDFSRPSTEERFFLIDMHNYKLIRKSLVAHGRNSGDDLASLFSDELHSNKSSLGFYITGETYTGKHGLSLRLDGTESGYNKNARLRDIVVHAADYVCPGAIKTLGRLGRSFGCPALPAEGFPEIVQQIKNGSCLFAYYPDQDYLDKSPILNSGACLDNYVKDFLAFK
jgi:hypothetical protein